MRQREFIAALGGAAAWPVAARAQQHGQVPRLGTITDGLYSPWRCQRRWGFFSDRCSPEEARSMLPSAIGSPAGCLCFVKVASPAAKNFRLRSIFDSSSDAGRCIWRLG